jgi:HTH-type transcriptional regulator/antitoxin MqsA
MRHEVRDVPYECRGHKAVITAVKGWHCPHCREVEFDAGEGVRFADAIDAQEAAELERIRKKLKLTQKEAAQITGGGPNAFSRYKLGKAKPMPAVVNLFKLLDRPPELLDEIRAA